jgi:hypothetical protein
MADQKPYFNESSQSERAETLRNDNSTYFEQARSTVGSEMGGRFQILARGQQHVVGTAPIAYPAQPPGSPWGNSYILPDEPALGVDLEAVPDMESVDGLPRQPSSTQKSAYTPNPTGGAPEVAVLPQTSFKRRF